MRRRIACLLTMAVLIVSVFSVVAVPVSAQERTLKDSIDRNAAVVIRQDLIGQMATTTTRRQPTVELPTIPTTPPAIVYETITAVDASEYYGRQVLASRENPDLVRAYDYFAQQVSELAQVVKFDEFRVTKDEIATIFYYYRNDHPEAFWLPSGFELYSFGYSVITGMPSVSLVYYYTVPKEDIPSLQAQLQAKVAQLLKNITPSMSLEERDY